jgi:hypothetical protein
MFGVLDIPASAVRCCLENCLSLHIITLCEVYWPHLVLAQLCLYGLLLLLQRLILVLQLTCNHEPAHIHTPGAQLVMCLSPGKAVCCVWVSDDALCVQRGQVIVACCCLIRVAQPLAGKVKTAAHTLDACAEAAMPHAKIHCSSDFSPPGHLVKGQRRAGLRCRVAAVHCWQQFIPQPEQCAAEWTTQLSKLSKQLQCS